MAADHEKAAERFLGALFRVGRGQRVAQQDVNTAAHAPNAQLLLLATALHFFDVFLVYGEKDAGVGFRVVCHRVSLALLVTRVQHAARIFKERFLRTLLAGEVGLDAYDIARVERDGAPPVVHRRFDDGPEFFEHFLVVSLLLLARSDIPSGPDQSVTHAVSRNVEQGGGLLRETALPRRTRIIRFGPEG